MEMPRPGEAHTRLAKLAGRFEARETMFPSPWDPKGGERRAVTVNRMDVDGFFLVNEYTQYDGGGHAVFRGLGIYGWDARRARYSMYWVDSMGMPPGEVVWGQWQGDVLTFAQSGERGHTRYVYEVRDDGYRFRLETSRDGQTWEPMMVGEYARLADG